MFANYKIPSEFAQIIKKQNSISGIYLSKVEKKYKVCNTE